MALKCSLSTILYFSFSICSKIVYDGKELIEILREDLWIATQKLVDRMKKVDAPKILAVDFVTKITNHLEKIRLMKENNEMTFKTTSYLVNDDKEIEFLKKISEIVVILLLPRGYSIAPLKNLLCEIIACKVFYSTIKIVTEPDYINTVIVECVQSKLASIALSRRSFEYASSFQDFLRMINTSSSVDELLQIRSSIINDLMQATTTQNLQRAKGIDIESGSTAGLKRSEINVALKLKKYIQQLMLAKCQCEKNLTKLGWVGSCSNDLNLSLHDILSTVVGRKYFIIFLESLNAGNLVGFFTSIEELRSTHKANIHQLGAEIYYAYIRPSFEIKLDKFEQKKIESFLLGDDASHEFFFDIQKNVLKLLEEKYHQPFLLSDEYKKLKNSITTEDISSISMNSLRTNFDVNAAADDELEDYDTGMDLTNHSTYAKNKLEQLQERLKNKKNAFEALKSSVKPDSQILTILEKEIENLKNEKRQLEAHLLRTETWTENLGKWRATVESVEIPEDKDTPEFLIVVQVDEMPKEATEEENYDENISAGWVVLRTLDDFHELHKKIRPLCTQLKSLDLPSNNTFILFFGKNDKGSLDKAKSQIQRYLNVSIRVIF
jgi:sorting nexin-25